MGWLVHGISYETACDLSGYRQ